MHRVAKIITNFHPSACFVGVLGLIYRIKLNHSDDHTWTTGPVVILT